MRLIFRHAWEWNKNQTVQLSSPILSEERILKLNHEVLIHRRHQNIKTRGSSKLYGFEWKLMCNKRRHTVCSTYYMSKHGCPSPVDFLKLADLTVYTKYEIRKNSPKAIGFSTQNFSILLHHTTSFSQFVDISHKDKRRTLQQTMSVL